jgi:PAS domain S-box-containing protein
MYAWGDAMTSTSLVSFYDYGLVVLSAFIAVLSSYAALDLAGRVTASRGATQTYWLAGGATAMGIGIWSMHFTGMLAFTLPVPVLYDWPTVLLSLLLGILSSAVALFVVSRRKMGWLRVFGASLLMGGGIAALHYTSMAAMRLAAMCRYSPLLVALSVAVAIAFSLIALQLKFLFRDERSGRTWRKIASALLMGAAISVMHYTAMAAAVFMPSGQSPDTSHAVSISYLASLSIAIVTLMILGIAIVTCLYDRLQKQTALLDELFEQAPQAVTLMDSRHRIIRVNREFCRVFGYAPEDAIGRRLSELIIPEESRDEDARYADLVAHGQRVDAEGVRRRKNGSLLYASIVQVPVSVPGGQVVSYTILNDITERKRAEEAVGTSEERWRSIFENSAVGIVLTDPNGFFTAANRAFQQLVGYTEEELRALSYLDITHEEDRPADAALNRHLWEGSLPQFTLEKPYRRKDGKLIWVRTTVSLAPGSETVPRFAMGIVEEITERKNAEQQLRRSEAYLAAGQRLSHTGSWAWNISTGELFWSQETFRIFGFDPTKTTASIAETFLARIHPEDLPMVEQGLKAAATGPRDYAVDYRIVLPDSSIKIIHIHDVVYSVTNEAGEVVERYGVVMDVTERKRAEEKLQHSFEQLRALGARLQKVREEERTRVAREIHDQLRQALTAIKMDLAALTRELPADRPQPSVRIDRLLKLVDETIQSVRRIATELRPGILDDLGLVAAVEWAAEEFQARTGTTCRVRLPESDIAMDPDRATALFRIFQETLTNVARHANATEVDVTLARSNGDLSLEVRDNGKGIADAKLIEGHSLGILGMRERALLLGGEFTISATPGTGTTVKVLIPVAGHK